MLSLGQYRIFFMTSFAVSSETVKYESNLVFFFFFKTVPSILDAFHFHMNFKISLSICTKNPPGVFNRDCVESEDQVGENVHFNNIVLQPINRECLSIHLGIL